MTRLWSAYGQTISVKVLHAAIIRFRNFQNNKALPFFMPCDAASWKAFNSDFLNSFSEILRHRITIKPYFHNNDILHQFNEL